MTAKGFAIAICFVVLVAACSDTSTESTATQAPAAPTTTAPPATARPTTTASTVPATTTPTTVPATTTSTTQPKPPVKAVGLVPLPGAQLDFTGVPVPSPSLVWSLYSGSGGIFVENIGGPLAPGCHGISFFDPNTFDLLQIDGKDLEAYATRGAGGCDGMQLASLDEGVIDGDAVTINTEQLIVFDFGDLPGFPYEVSTQIVDPGGGDGVFRSADPDAQLFENDLTGATHVIGADVLLAVDPATGELTLVQPPRPTPGACDEGAFCVYDRFAIDVSDAAGSPGLVVVSSDGAGLFAFNADNWEVLVRVVNGCQFNDHFWVFAAATTSVEYTLTVTDTVGAESRAYSNPLGSPSPAVVDTDAFATCP